MSADPPPDPQPLRLEVEDLCVERGGRPVIDGLGFSLASGEALLVTGRNGAGKSTLLRAIAGLLPLRRGRVGIAGAKEDEPSGLLHYLAHADGLKTPLTARENLDFWARFLGGGGLSPTRALERVGLAHVGEAPVAILSAGQKRRIALARLLVANRPLWLLDEPTSALDRAARERLAETMRAHLAEGGMIVAATHEPLGLTGTRELALGAAP